MLNEKKLHGGGGGAEVGEVGLELEEAPLQVTYGTVQVPKAYRIDLVVKDGGIKRGVCTL